jgi:transposase-like protein
MNTTPSQGVSAPSKDSVEYRQRALELWRVSGRSGTAVAAELGIKPSSLYRWARQAKEAAQRAGIPPGQPELKAAMQAEIERLKRENASLRDQRENLRTALGIVAKAPSSVSSRSRR